MRKTIGNLVDITPDLIWLKDLKMEKLEWLWPNRIPLGMITLLVGPIEVGKSSISMDIASRVSRGLPWPDDPNIPCKKGSVLLITAEDHPTYITLPRLAAAGADITKFCKMGGMTMHFKGAENKKRFFDLKMGIAALEHMKQEVPDLRLVIIDPITSYMGDINSHDNSEVRSVLDKVADWAGRSGVAVLVITHLNKNTAMTANFRIMGSVAFAAVARVIWHVSIDKDDRNRRLFLPGPSNIGVPAKGLVFGLKSVKVGDGSVDVDTAVCQWGEETDETAEEQLQAIVASLKSTSRNCAQWMKDFLRNGPMLATDCWAAATAAGFASATVNRVKKRLGVTSARSKLFDNQYVWKL